MALGGGKALEEDFIPALLSALRAEQPPDPVRFLRTHLDSLVASAEDFSAEQRQDDEEEEGEAGPILNRQRRPRSTAAPPSASGDEPAEAADTELLRAELDKLRRENEVLRAAASSLGREDDTQHVPRATRLTCCTWNLAGVNENPFEFKASSHERFSRVADFIHAVDHLLAQMVYTHDEDHEEDEDSQVQAAVTDSLAIAVRKMPIAELLQGLLVVAQAPRADVASDSSAALTSSEGGTEENHREPLAVLQLGTAESTLAAALADLVDKHPPSLLDVLFRGTSSGYFSSPDLKLKGRKWCLTNSQPTSVRRFLTSCRCFAKEGTAAEEAAWWSHWLSSLCSNVPADKQDPALALPLAIFDGLLAKIAGNLVADMKEDEREAFLGEMKAYVMMMRTTSEAKAKAVGAGLEWTIASYAPCVIALQEFNASWLGEPAFKRFWTEKIEGEGATEASEEGFEVIKPLTLKNEMQQMILLIRKRSALQLDHARTAEMARYIRDRDALAQSLQERFGALYPERIVESQVKSALQALTAKVAVAVCSLQCADGKSLGLTPATEIVLVVGAHASSDGTDNRAIVAAVQELALWVGRQPGVAATPRLMVLMDANSAAVFPKQKVMQGAATQQAFSLFLRNEHELTSCWLQDGKQRLRSIVQRLRSEPSKELARTLSGTPLPSLVVGHTVMKERTHLQTQWKKSGALDMSLKDWIVLSSEDTASKVCLLQSLPMHSFMNAV